MLRRGALTRAADTRRAYGAKSGCDRYSFRATPTRTNRKQQRCEDCVLSEAILGKLYSVERAIYQTKLMYLPRFFLCIREATSQFQAIEEDGHVSFGQRMFLLCF